MTDSLCNDEELILPELLKYSLIRYYVVRNIRRKITKTRELDELRKDLNKINQETI